MAYTQRQAYWIWLSSVQGLGARRFDALMAMCDAPRQVWEDIGPWMEPVLGRQAYAALKKAKDSAYFEQLFASIERAGAIAITREDEQYPARLRAIADPPPVLYVRGRVAQAGGRCFAIVGARNSTAYGTRMARRIAQGLSQAGVTVVSGLARGIDSAAHRGAIDCAARTVAVLGSGVDVVYPPEHLMLSEEILGCGGSILSEQPPGAKPLKHHFPARNRIISGMCEGVLLVEGERRSGAMSTVSLAMEQGREVFALPGQADSLRSELPHLLIREGARLATSARDIIEDMGWQMSLREIEKGSHHVTDHLPLTQQEQRIYALLEGGPVGTDTIIEQLALPAQEVGALLTVMELQGTIRMLPGRRVQRAETGL